MQILYGRNKYTDVTNYFIKDDFISIPVGDRARADIAKVDPDPGVLKHIIILHNHSYFIVENQFGLYTPVNELNYLSIQKSQQEMESYLMDVHKTIIFNYGYIQEEVPEQLMALRFIKPTDTVLELGANIGRNTCVISRILNDNKRLVTLETDIQIAHILDRVRIENGMNFNIINAGLSKSKVIQRGWDSIQWNPVEPIPEGWTEVNTITLSAIKERYSNLSFNVLVADCEGALYYICQDEPDFFSNFNRIIMENDYRVAEHKQYIDNELTRQGFVCIYSESGGWGPCESCFFETWLKI